MQLTKAPRPIAMQAHHANTQLVGWWSGTRGVGGKSLLCIFRAVPTVPCLGTATVPCLGTSTVPCLGTFAVPAWDACQYPAWVRLPVPCLGTLASPCLGRLLVPCLGTLTDPLPGNVLPVFFFFFAHILKPDMPRTHCALYVYFSKERDARSKSN